MFGIRVKKCQKRFALRCLIQKGKPSNGRKFTIEDTIKASKVNKGNKYALGNVHTEKWKKIKSKSMTGENNHFFGKHHTEESKEKRLQTIRNKKIA